MHGICLVLDRTQYLVFILFCCKIELQSATYTDKLSNFYLSSNMLIQICMGLHTITDISDRHSICGMHTTKDVTFCFISSHTIDSIYKMMEKNTRALVYYEEIIRCKIHLKQKKNCYSYSISNKTWKREGNIVDFPPKFVS